MRAVRYERYGPPEILHRVEVVAASLRVEAAARGPQAREPYAGWATADACSGCAELRFASDLTQGGGAE